MLEPPVDRVRISQVAKDQLIKLKRVTKIRPVEHSLSLGMLPLWH
jgi:DNA sulfur modification protein DndE